MISKRKQKNVLILFTLIILNWGLLEYTVAGAWTLEKGSLWLKTAVFFQSTSSRFCTAQEALSPAFHQVGCTETGQSAPFDPFIGGKSNSYVVYTEVIYGLTGWLDQGIQIPFYSLEFTNLANPNRPRSSSFGDIRFLIKYRLLQQPMVWSITLAAKSPSGKFNIDAEAVNVSEGQWDFDFFTEVSKSFWPVPAFASFGLGFRIRNDNEDFEHTMADEMILIGELGYEFFPNLMIKGMIDWLQGQRPRIKATNTPLLEQRELLTIAPSINYRLQKQWYLEVGVRFPISGQDFPDGPQFMGAISYQLSVL
jgi:hypothetical protein